MVISRLKPRSTIAFENENQERLRPVAASLGYTANGIDHAYYEVGISTTREDSGITRHRNTPRLNALPAVSDTGNGIIPTTGQQMGNITFDLQGFDIRNTPQIHAMIIIDPDNSILGEPADGIITVNYTDDTDTGRVHVLQLTVDGLGYFETAFPVKSIESVVGTIFDTSGGGQPDASDTFWMGPAAGDTVHEILRANGFIAFGPSQNPGQGGSNGNAMYVEADDASDKVYYVKLGDHVDEMNLLSINNVRMQWFFKNVGNPAGMGCRGTFRTDDAQLDWPLTSMDLTGTETGVYTISDSGSMTTNPRTSNPWTLQEIRDLQVGAIFIGESGPTVPKRCAFMRVRITAEAGFEHDVIDGRDIANIDQAFEAVNKDPFTTPTNDELQHVKVSVVAGTPQVRWDVEQLPVEATSVISSEVNLRMTYRNQGDPDGAGAQDIPCGIGLLERSNPDTHTHFMEGVREQSNIGGFKLSQTLSGTILDPIRNLVGVGNPESGGCGNVSNQQDGDDLGFGTYVDKSFLRTLNSGSNPITVANINAMDAGCQLTRIDHEYRISRVYVEVEYRRDPVGETFFHLAVDDDPLTPDDSNFMESKHTNNKEFSVDFAGIPEVTSVTSVKIIVRAQSAVGATAGWRVKWRLAGQSDVLETVVNNVNGFANFEYSRTISPFTSLPWTRAEVNGLVAVWEAQGENDFFGKQIGSIILEVDFEAIPEKIDAARNIVSRKLRLLRKPRPWLTIGLPPKFADIKMLADVPVIHNAIPRTAATLGFERWDRSLFRLFRKRIRHMNDDVLHSLLDVREYLTTMWITGSTRTKGQTADGMAVLTPGISTDFLRGTNDYFPDPFAGLIQELNSDEPPSDQRGILIQNGATNRIVNSAFAEGAPNVFTDWTQTIGAGGSIAEDLTEKVFEDDIQGNQPRTVSLITPSTPGDGTILNQINAIPTGETPASPQGSDYILTIGHRDVSAQPLSVRCSIDPPSFTEEDFDFGANEWMTGADIWLELPVRSEFTIDRVLGTFARMELIPNSPLTPVLDFNVHIAGRTVAGAENRVMLVNLEGGKIETNEASRYPTNPILTRNGPVIRDAMAFSLDNERTRPIYPADGRGTFTVEVEPIWDAVELPRAAGVSRYIFGWVVDGQNEESLRYDADTESFIYLRKIANVSLTSTVFFPAGIAKGCPIQLATRWISVEGDLGETPFSASLFVNGRQGNTFVHTQKFPMPTSKPFYIGSRDGTNGECFDGFFRKLECKQIALTAGAIDRIFT